MLSFKVDLPFFVNNFHRKTNLVLDRETFISALTHFACLSSSGLLGMVYELLQDCFVLDDFTNGFDIFLRYASTSFMVMFLHLYHVCLLHHDYWLWKHKLEVLDPSRLER